MSNCRAAAHLAEFRPLMSPDRRVATPSAQAGQGVVTTSPPTPPGGPTDARAADWTVDNAAWASAHARLSVLIPFHRDDPRPLLRALDRERAAAVEIIVLDDGSALPELVAGVSAAVAAMALPVRFITLATNEGRAKGRNRLARHARARRLLFLDADMVPDSERFLADWLLLIETEDPPVAFGGLSLDQTPVTREHALHRAMALKSHRLSARQRMATPEKHVFTSNLMVRRDIFDLVAFDEGFSGWGWEDVEWAMRVARRWPIVHVDIPASHLGLDTAVTLAGKYEQSAANFARVVTHHRQVVRTYPSYRVARLLKRLPLRRTWRPLLRRAALANLLPLSIRAFVMRLYRAALYAEAL